MRIQGRQLIRKAYSYFNNGNKSVKVDRAENTATAHYSLRPKITENNLSGMSVYI